MGIEDFLVSLDPADGTDADASVRAIPGVAVVVRANAPSGETHFLVESDRFVIELEVFRGPPRSRVSARFAVCQPSEVDEAFAGLVWRLGRSLDAMLTIREDSATEDLDPRTIASAQELATLMSAHIHEKRAMWQRHVGPRALRATCDEALNKFLMGGGGQGA